jgi:2-oxoglutarate dehydrogenase E1 component
MYENWLQDKSSVHASWNAYFTNLSKGLGSSSSFNLPPTGSAAFTNLPQTSTTTATSAPSKSVDSSTHLDTLRSVNLTTMVYKYRKNIHEIADVNPLNNQYHLVRNNKDGYTPFVTVVENPQKYGFSQEELDIPVDYDSSRIGFASNYNKNKWTPREVHDVLMKSCGGKISFEYIFSDSEDVIRWFKGKIEKYPQFELTKAERSDLLERITESHAFTEFCKKKYTSSKRFGIDGCDAMISGLEKCVDHAKTLGVTNIVMGMAHRGRLNTLTSVFDKPYEQIFTEFSDPGLESQKKVANADWGFSGDVKYHLGASHQRTYPDGSKMNLSMLPNPSHLETINPVVLGKARAKQYNIKDFEGKQVLPILIHGDAAIAGQGIVYETLQMENIDSYKVGGTIHVVVNNQVGFTTNSNAGRSCLYSTDIAKITKAPVIHVNADEPEYVDWAFTLAAEYRQKFGRDIYIDIIGYRIFGHNEQDMPKFTQPEMYKILDKKKGMYDLYTKSIVEKGQFTQEEVDAVMKKFELKMENAFEASKKTDFDMKRWDSSVWDKSLLNPSTKDNEYVKTAVTKKDLLFVNSKINNLPESLNAHSIIKRVYQTRKESFETGEGIDWAAAEMMAYGTLIDQGFRLRMSGEDVQRGTFSHRHAVIYDQEDYHSYSTLSPILEDDKHYQIEFRNSHLAEYAPLGFEYGYSISKPKTLTLWEAQFGDFANVA